MAEQIIPPAKLAHFVIRSPRYEDSIAWWRTVLGAEVRHQNDFLCFLADDDEHHRLAILSVPTLAELLPDPRLSHMARYALERIPDAQAGAALRNSHDREDGVSHPGRGGGYSATRPLADGIL